MSIHLLRTEWGVLQLKIDTLLSDLGPYCSTPRPLNCLQWDLERSLRLFTIHSCQSPMVLLLDLLQLIPRFSYVLFKIIPEQYTTVILFLTKHDNISWLHTIILYFKSVFRNHNACIKTDYVMLINFRKSFNDWYCCVISLSMNETPVDRIYIVMLSPNTADKQ